MQLKRFEAPTIHDALKKIKDELGDNAVIFSSRVISKDGLNGRGSPRRMVEVMAAIERSGDSKTAAHPKLCMQPSSGDRGARAGMCGEEPSGGDGGSLVRPCLQPVALFDERYQHTLRHMLGAGFTSEAAHFLLGQTRAEIGKDPVRAELALDRIRETIARYVRVAGPLKIRSRTKKTVALVGPTGVGKTTTVAKIAAHCALEQRMRVKLFTIDTYRIAAAEQLSVYGRIMGLPVSVIKTPQELGREIAASSDADLILIDTAGRNYRNEAHVKELEHFLAPCNDIEIHLLLSATTAAPVLQQTAARFADSRIDRLIITKIDEAEKMGHMFTVLLQNTMPVSYLTCGQQVPEDILPASKQVLAGMLLHGYDN